MKESTEAQKMQHKLFQQLGTLARTSSNLRQFATTGSIYQWSSNTFPVKPTYLEKLILEAAAIVVSDMMRRTQEEMQKLPSKKNLLKEKK